MGLSPSAPYVELLVPNAGSEREFLFLAVQAAAKKYREIHHPPIVLPQTICADGCALHQSVR